MCIMIYISEVWTRLVMGLVNRFYTGIISSTFTSVILIIEHVLSLTLNV